MSKLQAFMLSLALVLGASVLAGSTAQAEPYAAQSQAAPAVATQAASSEVTTKPQESTAEVMDAPESEHDIDGYRFSPSVQRLAHWLHLPVQKTSEWVEDLNSIILFLIIFYFLFKWMPRVFRGRSERIARELVEAKSTTEEANQRLAMIEKRLSHLDSDIASYRERSAQEMVEEETRMRQSLEAERKRLVSSAEAEIAQARSAAERELTRYTAELALAQARREIEVTPAEDERLIASFGESLAAQKKEEVR